MESLNDQPRHRAKCIEWIRSLRDNGHELRRPRADYLRNGIYELRVKFGIQYRMFYFFYGRERSVITHGITKQAQKVPSDEIDRAVRMRHRYEHDPESHSYWEMDHE